MTGARTYRSLRHNPPLGGEDELIRGSSGAPTKDSNTLTPFPLVFWAQSPALTPAPPLILSFTEELC